MPTATKTEEFQIKGLKTAGGDETLRFEVSLYFRGKKVASISNEGCGGSHRWHWLDNEARLVFSQYVKTLSFEIDFEQEDQFIDNLISKKTHNTWLKSKCKNQTLFLLHGDADYEYRTVKRAFDSDVKAFLIRKYGDQIKEIVNEALAK